MNNSRANELVLYQGRQLVCVEGVKSQSINVAAMASCVFLPTMLLTALIAIRSSVPGWLFMWLIGVSIFAILKWLTWIVWYDAVRQVGMMRHIGYLLMWPGLDAGRFLDPGMMPVKPTAREWVSAGIRALCGFLLIYGVANQVSDTRPMLRAWIGAFGVVCILHFGIFQLLSLMWRHVGVDAPAIMNAPMRSTSLAELWSERWNVAFRDAAHFFVFQPLRRCIRYPLSQSADRMHERQHDPVHERRRKQPVNW